MNSETKPRFSFEISEEQQSRALRVFEQYGMRKAVFSPILDEVMDMIEEYGNLVVAVLLDKNTKIRKVIPSLAKAERMAEK
jgi:hypothetical protein